MAAVLPSRRLAGFLLCACFFYAGTPASVAGHPYYVSVTQIDYNPETEALEITIRLFTDDLEQALEAQGAGNLHLGGKRESKEADRYVRRYLERNVIIAVDDLPAPYRYLGKEVEIQATWCYVEVTHVPAVKKIRVMNRLLMELHDTQTNIVHVKVAGKEKSLLLTPDKYVGTLEF